MTSAYGLQFVKPGDPIRASTFNALIAAVRGSAQLNEPGYQDDAGQTKRPMRPTSRLRLATSAVDIPSWSIVEVFGMGYIEDELVYSVRVAQDDDPIELAHTGPYNIPSNGYGYVEFFDDPREVRCSGSPLLNQTVSVRTGATQFSITNCGRYEVVGQGRVVDGNQLWFVRRLGGLMILRGQLVGTTGVDLLGNVKLYLDDTNAFVSPDYVVAAWNKCVTSLASGTQVYVAEVAYRSYHIIAARCT